MGTMAVAVVNYNTRELLRGALASAMADGAREIVVADNGSTDGSAEMVRAEFPSVELVVDRSNPGYGAASNAAIRRTRADYVLLLNSDTLLPAGALAALASYLDREPRVGMVGPRLRGADGRLEHSCHDFPTPLVSLLEYSWVGDIVKALPVVRRRYARSWAHDRPRRIDWVTGAALAIRRRAFDDVEGFDESFFMYFEEVDLAYRMLEAGWETHFAPVTDVTHFGGQSTKQQRTAMFSQQFRAAMQFYHKHRTPAETARAVRALRFALRSKLVIGAVRHALTSDEVYRSAITVHMADCRHVLGESWQRATAQQS